MEATRDRQEAMEWLGPRTFWFGEHNLHHLFPTVDHARLPLLRTVFKSVALSFSCDNPMFCSPPFLPAQVITNTHLHRTLFP